MSTNITWHHGHITRSERERQLNQRGVTLWFTGLSGAGKSTVATALERELVLKYKKSMYVLDGDNIRHGLNKDLGFGPGDRQENIRRIGEVCKLFNDAGIIVLAAFVSPYKEDRDNVRILLEATDATKTEGGDSDINAATSRKNFVEVYVQADVSVCEQRDPKGLYKKARLGEIKSFTGVSADAPFECPENPELILNTGTLAVEDCVSQLVDYLSTGGYLEY
jgi:adenylylsulfate kinase